MHFSRMQTTRLRNSMGYIKSDRQTDGRTDGRMDRQTDRHTDRQTDRQTDMTENITCPHTRVVKNSDIKIENFLELVSCKKGILWSLYFNFRQVLFVTNNSTFHNTAQDTKKVNLLLG